METLDDCRRLRGGSDSCGRCGYLYKARQKQEKAATRRSKIIQQMKSVLKTSTDFLYAFLIA